MEKSTQQQSPASIKHLFAHNLNKLYYGKRYLYEKMPHLIDIASFEALRLALKEVHEDIGNQVTRLEEVYRITGITASDDNCNPFIGFFKGALELELQGAGFELLDDMNIMLYMQLLEHMNVIAFRMLRILADAQNLKEIDQLLLESFDESIDDDRLFVMITEEYLKDHKNTGM